MDIIGNDESIEDLQYKGLKIIQSKQCFCFGMDAVLFSDFIKLKKGETVVDLCTGSGIIPILLSAKNKASQIIGIEIMPYVADLAKRSIALNKLSDTVCIIEADIKQSRKILDGVFDVVCVNPPYEKSELDKKSDNEYRAVAKHEVLCTLSDVCKSASKLLKFGGRFYMVHRPQRLTEIIDTMKDFKLQPKKIRFVHPKVGAQANLVLIEGLKNGKEGLVIEYPLFVRNESGEYTQQIDRIYHRNEEN
jgi:tRNA1Val (adenine37-N6)-methyltransferase